MRPVLVLYIFLHRAVSAALKCPTPGMQTAGPFLFMSCIVAAVGTGWARGIMGPHVFGMDRLSCVVIPFINKLLLRFFLQVYGLCRFQCALHVCFVWLNIADMCCCLISHHICLLYATGERITLIYSEVFELSEDEEEALCRTSTL